MPRHSFLFTVAVIFFAAFGLSACGSVTSNNAKNTIAPIATAQISTPTASAPRASATPRVVTPTRPARVNGFQTIARDELPRQAIETLTLIERGGPFPYRQDGQIFQNREGILPKKARGYYHEYTVETPGSEDRGARRIVTGEQGELYYTSDHYNSFKVILVP